LSASGSLAHISFCSEYVHFRRKADTAMVAQNIGLWPLADISSVAFDVAFGGKADMPVCIAHVCF
jgi:hypothetical protein